MKIDKPLPRTHYKEHLENLKGKCAFCNMDKDLNIFETENWIWAYSAFPYRKFNTLLISKRHLSKFNELNELEVRELQELTLKIEEIYKEKKIIGKSTAHGDQLFYAWRSRSENSMKESVAHFHLHIYPKFSSEDDTPQQDDAWDIDIETLKEIGGKNFKI